jgi:hypothetical protein
MWEKNTNFLYISSTNIHRVLPSLYQCVETRSIEVAFHVSCPSCEPLYATNLSHRKQEYFFMNILCIESFTQKTRIRERCSSVVHASSTVEILTYETSLWTCARVCYLNCHETGLYYYLMIHIGNLLHLLQLFYFHLWPTYWLSLVNNGQRSESKMNTIISICKTRRFHGG